MGAEITDGVFAYRSRHEPVPLTGLKKMLVVTACAGNTSWHHMIYRAARYAPDLSNYAGAAGGRTFPSAAGFHTSQSFFTDEQFRDIVDTDTVWPITFVDHWSMAELTVELGTSCYAGALMLQAIGLGGWMFNGDDAFAMLGASGDPAAPGLGFRYDTDPRWPYPNPTGLEGVMEGCCPPNHPDMRAAVEALCACKFGPGGPFHPDTPGPWQDSPRVRSAARVHDEQFRECVALQAQYVYDTFEKFPGTVPSMFLIMYLQAHHLDLDFYDTYYRPGSYLKTHANHMADWHGRIRK